MNEITLPPSPNWYLNNICACSKDGTIAWGSNNSIVIARRQQNSKILNYSIIKDAYKERINVLSFSPEYGEDNKNLLVSGADEHTVKIWNLDNNSTIMAYSFPNTNHTVVGVDWCIKDPNIIYCISNDGILISWTIHCNTCIEILRLQKVTVTCLSTCPHDCNLIAIGSKTGLVYIVDTRGTGTIRYRLRGHDTEICSLSWCPVEHNILTDEKNKDYLLASGGRDKSIFLWRAGGDGRYESELTLPNSSFESRYTRNKLNKYSSNNNSNWTSVCWASPTLLLTSSFWGEILAWNLNTIEDAKPKLVHSRHNRAVFFICKEPNINKTSDDSSENNNSVTVWSSSLDRRIVCCNIKKDSIKIKYDITSQGGYVYSIAACPLETSLIAFGVGDAMLRIWNLSEEHKTLFDITVFWQKIKGSIKSIAWHPTKENLVAYGTSEGRIGVLDISSNKPPILYRKYYTKTVYTLQWGPYHNSEIYTLYSCGELDLIHYSPNQPSQEPVVIFEKKCTEFSWNPSYSILAVAFKNGTIRFYNRKFEECGYLSSTMNSSIFSFKWHPDSTTTDLNFSHFRNYMAVSYADCFITILNLSDLVEKIDEANRSPELIDVVNDSEISSKVVGKVFTTLNGHSEQIADCAWNPHLSGYLVSCSYDCTAQVWNVDKQEVIATFVNHQGPVYSCMWSPIDPDVIITGSADLTLRLWKISSQSVVKPKQKSKKNTSVKIKQRLKENSNTGSNSSNVENIKTSEVTTEQKPLETEKNQTEISMATTKEVNKKSKEKKSYFPIQSKVMNTKLAILKSIKSLIKDEDHFLNLDYKTKEATTQPTLLSEEAILSEIFNSEKSVLTTQNNHMAVTEMSMWYGKLEENLEIAVKEKRLNDTLVSLSPSLSMKTWRTMCEAYANQLILESNPTKAVSYLLCIHKIYEAINVFQDAKMYKEAYCLAKSQLDTNDEIITKILENWATYESGKGHLEGAAHCYVKLGSYSEAASLLARRKDVDSLIIASKLALLSDENVLSKSLAEQALIESLKNSAVSNAKYIIERFPQVKYLEVLINAYEMLKKIINIDINESTICTWIKGKLEFDVLQVFGDYCEQYKNYYNDLCQYNFNQVIDNQPTLWISASSELAMAFICDSTEKRLTHLINLYTTFYKFELQHRNHGNYFIKVLLHLDTKSPIKSDSIYEGKYTLSKSLRAYLCVGLLNWIVDKKNKISINDQSIEIIELIEDLLEDIFEKQTVRFWFLTSEISKLETQIFNTLGKKERSSESSAIEDETVLIQKLDSMKNEKKQFINERINSPNPILAYTKANDLIDKFPSETFISTFAEKLDKLWTNATS
ncbi:PREDICTED: gem-associated protein 5 [Polistes dominula]|uniref:Gem-associated protein 5 n=1 Tax=Polistes dominula TaxID=743375 RepID=A0ABM1IWS8_POLDO|nr:PREDICTED: gem-associated protein 5 [Polistes dominula]